MSTEPTHSDFPAQDAVIEQADLPAGESYVIEKPIPVSIVREGDIDFTASFKEARISICGESFRDAFEALVNEILDAFDYLTQHETELGSEPQRQLAVFRGYIVILTSSDG